MFHIRQFVVVDTAQSVPSFQFHWHAAYDISIFAEIVSFLAKVCIPASLGFIPVGWVLCINVRKLSACVSVRVLTRVA